MVFECGIIIGLRGFDFRIETAEVGSFPIMSDIGEPCSSALVKINADKLRRGVFSFCSVAVILRVCREAQICPAVIETIVVFVVNEEAMGRIHNLSVHGKYHRGAVTIEPDGVETAAVFFCAPVETIQPVEVLRVNDGEFASGEANFAKGIAVFVLAIKKNRPGEDEV
jgi:hypothetical protein